MNEMTDLKKLKIFMELLNATGNFELWEYNSRGTLLWTSCSDPVLEKLFVHLGGVKVITEHACKSRMPLVLWSKADYIWLTVYYCNEAGQVLRIFVLGPLNCAETISRWSGREGAVLPVSILNHMRTDAEQLPTMAMFGVIRYTLMMHKAVCDENISQNDILFSDSEMMRILSHDSTENKGGLKRDRWENYNRQTLVLDHIRNGDLNYQKDYDRMIQVGSGTRIRVSSSVERGKYSVVSFISLCMQAAIQGGMLPDEAYSRGDRYTQAVLSASSVGELREISHSMYEMFVRSVHELKRDSSLSRNIQLCCDYINANIEEDISIARIAERLGYSDYYLTKKFIKETGISMKEYIRRGKTERAKQLLKNTDLNIQEISERLNFSSRSYFAKVFYSETGMRPAEFREQK